jgi:hypothetical protein
VRERNPIFHSSKYRADHAARVLCSARGETISKPAEQEKLFVGRALSPQGKAGQKRLFSVDACAAAQQQNEKTCSRNIFYAKKLLFFALAILLYAFHPRLHGNVSFVFVDTETFSCVFFAILKRRTTRRKRRKEGVPGHCCRMTSHNYANIERLLCVLRL